MWILVLICPAYMYMWYNVKSIDLITGITPPFKLVAADIRLGASLEAYHPPVTHTLLTIPTPLPPSLSPPHW